MKITGNILNCNRHRTEVKTEENGELPLDRQSILKLIREQIDETMYGSVEEQSEKAAKISEKIAAGKKLTQSEMDYIREKQPGLYVEVKRIQMKREAFEQKLKNCKSKKEVQEAYESEILSIGKKEPNKLLVIKNIDNALQEFKKTKKFSSLPKVSKEDKEKKAADNPGMYNYGVHKKGYQEAILSTGQTKSKLNLKV